MGWQSRVEGVSIVAILSSALAVAAWAPRAEAQALTCGADVSFTYDPLADVYFVGDEVTVVVTLDAGNIEGGAQPGSATFNHIQFDLDCDVDAGLNHPCTDDTQKISYLGDATIVETCPGTWTSDLPAGGPMPNTVTFTSDAPITLAEATTCTFSFGVEILEASDDSTPALIEQLAHTVATCSNGLTQPDIDVGALQVSDCQVTIDKTVNVEETPNWVDSAVTVDGQPADFRLIVSAGGDDALVGLQNCVVTDPDLGLEETIPTIAAGGSETIIVPGFCDVDGTRTNTATVTCECADRPDVTRTDTDTATLQCLSPGVNVTKTCVEPTDGGPFTFDIDVQNTGETALRCVVEDFIEPGACPKEPEGTADLTSTPFVVAAGGTSPVDFGPQTVEQTSCNVAVVTCEIGNMVGETFEPEQDDCINVVEGAGTCAVNGGTCATDADCGTKTITDTASEECAVEAEGCLTRTPGFWGTHPNVTAEFLDVWSCGHTLVTTEAGDPGSVTEDLCSIGRDQKEYDSPQQAQLTRQCAAAALNIAASLELAGSCEEELSAERFSECCGVDLCAEGTKEEITASGCIEDLDEFNNLELGEFDDQDLCHVLGLGPPCAADPSQCQEAGDNGIINADTTVVTPAPGAPLSAATTGGTSGGCASGSTGVLALLGLAALLPRLRRRRD